MDIESPDLSDATATTFYPLTVVQHDMWTGQILDPDRDFYNVGVGVECFGVIDPDLLEKAVRHVIGDADSHCLNFVDTKYGTRQFLRPLPIFNIPRLDFSREPSPQAAALAWMRADMAKGFDLTRGPLFRYALIKVAEDRFFLYFLNHHLIIDLFSGSLLMRRLGEVYSALAAHQTPPPSAFVSSLTLLEEEES
jgi:hypothetical protein